LQNLNAFFYKITAPCYGAGLLALRFHLRVLADALPVAEDDTHEWIN